MARKTRKHKPYTIEEKNDIVKVYVDGALGGYRQISNIMMLIEVSFEDG